MARILVVEPEERHVQRIRDALSSEGWQVQMVGSTDEALSAAENEPPQLVLVNRQTDGAERLFDAFSRRTGGPGTVALLPESAIDLADPLADEALAKPFTDQDLRLAVRRGLHSEASKPSGSSASPTAAPAPAAERQLTTQDIFGDVVAEVESEIESEVQRETRQKAPQEAPKPEPATPRAPQPPARPPARPPLEDDLDLEKTLSGLRRDLELDSRPTKPPESTAAERTVRPEPPQETKTRKRSRIADDLDIDALLSETLSGLDLPSTKRKKKPEKEATASPREEPPREEPDPQEISFADLSAPSLQEVPEPSPSVDEAPAGEALGDEVLEEMASEEEAEVDLEMDLEDFPSVDLESDLESSEPVPAAATDRDGDLGLAEGSMIEVEELTPDPGPDLGGLSDETAAEADGRDDGQRFGQYTLLDRIAVGGMAEVWKARMSGVEGFQKTVAIKKILPHLTDNDDFVDMFIDEAKLAAQLNHPNIIHIYDLGKIGDHFYIAMEYVEGKNLRALLNESRKKALPLPRGLAVLIAARLASALDHAHHKKDFEDRELGLVHRDVSPQNVLISEEGDIKLCDFGIVKAVSKASQTQMGALKGKLQYMSPEQAWGKDVDARSDIFSLGAILFEMLTGRRLFTGDNEISVLEAVRRCQVVAPRDLVQQIPEDVERITLKALEMDPERRYQTAGKMQQELESIVYSVKPALGQADLADYLKRLSTAPEAEETEAAAATSEEDAEAPREPVAPSAAASRPEEETEQEEARLGEAKDETGGSGPGEMLSMPLDAEAAESAAEPQTETPTQTGTETQTETLTQTGTETQTGTGDEILEPPPAAEVVQAVRGTALEDLEEGGRRGRMWLWILIALLLLAGAAVTYYLYFVRPATSSPTAEVEEPVAEESTEPLPSSPLDDIDFEDESEGGEGLDDGTTDEAGAEGADESAEIEGGNDPDPTSTAPMATAATAPAAQPVATRPPPTPPEEARDRPTEPQTPSARARTETPSREPERKVQEPTRPAADKPREPAPAETAEASPSRSAPVLLRPSSKAVESEGEAQTAEAGAAEKEADNEPEREPLETVDVAEPASRDSEPENEIASESETPRDTGREEVPRLRPAEPKPEPPPQPPPEPEVREGDLVGTGPGVKAPVLVRFDKPRYPPIARRMNVEGEVVLSLLVDENGRVLETRLIKGVREGVGLNEAALEAARRARYEPATKNGVRVKMWTTLRIPFRL